MVYAWLDDHKRDLGHFINNQWVRPDGRKTYDTTSPATGEKLASTVQGKATWERGVKWEGPCEESRGREEPILSTTLTILCALPYC